MSIDSPRVRIRLDARIKADGSLVLDGYDIGPTVLELWGDSDYEYWLTVDSHHLDRVFEEMLATRYPTPAARTTWLESHPGGVPARLLVLLQEAFASRDFSSDSEFRHWLTERDIPSEFSSWV